MKAFRVKSFGDSFARNIQLNWMRADKWLLLFIQVHPLYNVVKISAMYLPTLLGTQKIG